MIRNFTGFGFPVFLREDDFPAEDGFPPLDERVFRGRLEFIRVSIPVTVILSLGWFQKTQSTFAAYQRQTFVFHCWPIL